MNTRMRMILMAGALAAAASSLGSQAADQSAFFEQQRQITDGYYPQYTVVPTPARSKPATARTLQEDQWYGRERAQGSGNVAPVQFPVPAALATPLNRDASAAPAVSVNSRPVSAHTLAEDDFLTQERNETDGNVAPVQPPL
jgi:hypothetical protein